MAKLKFKQGVRAVTGKPNWWDVNYQVNGERVTKRIEAKRFDEALAWRLGKKTTLRKIKEGTDSEEPIFDLTEVFKLLMKKIEGDVELGAIDRKAISGVKTRFQRFFFDYPKHLGVNWVTTADFTAKDFDNYEKYYGITLGRKQGRSSEMRWLKTIFSYMRQEQWISRERFIELREVKCPPKNFTPLIPNPDEDYETVFAWLYENDIRSHDFYYFLRRTARRPGHVRELLRENTKLKEEYIYMAKEKHKEESWIPINDIDLKRVVSRALDFSCKLDSPYLFVNKHGRQCSKSNPLRVFQAEAKACEISNWQKWTPYQLKKKQSSSM